MRALILARFRAVREPPSNTILFIPLSGNYCNPDFDWAAAGGEAIIRFCPKCLCETIIGHGRRRKQAHDESHDWIGIRRVRIHVLNGSLENAFRQWHQGFRPIAVPHQVAVAACTPQLLRALLFFSDETLANRVAKAMVHAAEICGR